MRGPHCHLFCLARFAVSPSQLSILDTGLRAQLEVASVSCALLRSLHPTCASPEHLSTALPPTPLCPVALRVPILVPTRLHQPQNSQATCFGLPRTSRRAPIPASHTFSCDSSGPLPPHPVLPRQVSAVATSPRSLTHSSLRVPPRTVEKRNVIVPLSVSHSAWCTVDRSVYKRRKSLLVHAHRLRCILAACAAGIANCFGATHEGTLDNLSRDACHATYARRSPTPEC